MNESAAKSLRGSSSQAIDMEEFESRLRGSQPRPPGHDPLAELATLVNSAEDPFADLFADHQGTSNVPPGAVYPTAGYAPAPTPVAPPPAPATVRPPAPVAAVPAPVAPAPSAPAASSAADYYDSVADPVESYPEQAPAMLRSVADQMRSPGGASLPPVPVAAPPVSAAESHAASEPYAPVQYAESDDAPSPEAAPASYAPQPPNDALLHASQALEAAPALAEPAVLAAGDPVDEFEQSIAQLIAARTGAGDYSEAPAAQSDSAAPAFPVAVPAGYADQHAGALAVPENAYPQDYAPGVSEAPAISPGHEQGYSDTYNEPDPQNVRPAIPPEWLGENEVPPPPAGYGEPPKRSRKSLYLTGSALAVLVVGIGGALALRDSGGAGGTIPTITASADKMKIKAEGGAEKAVRSVSVLQSGKSGSQPSKVVQNGEQPIDLAQVPAEPKKARRIKEEELSKKLNLADRNMAKPIAVAPARIQSRRAAGGYFPEPRKVRTVMVRPDGSLIDPTASIKPAVKKVAAPVVRMPRSVQPARVEPATRSRAVAPNRRKAAARANVAKPVRSARPARNANTRSAALDLTPQRGRNAVRAPVASGGGYAVQLAAPASANAARSVAKRMRAKFGSVFGGRTPAVVRAVVKSRTVYRVRVTGLSRGSASKMCSQVKSKGGRCFVARN